MVRLLLSFWQDSPPLHFFELLKFLKWANPRAPTENVVRKGWAGCTHSKLPPKKPNPAPTDSRAGKKQHIKGRRAATKLLPNTILEIVFIKSIRFWLVRWTIGQRGYHLAHPVPFRLWLLFQRLIFVTTP